MCQKYIYQFDYYLTISKVIKFNNIILKLKMVPKVYTNNKIIYFKYFL